MKACSGSSSDRFSHTEKSHWFLSNSGLNGPLSRSGATGSYQTVDWMGPPVGLEPLVLIKQWTEWAPQSVWSHWFLSNSGLNGPHSRSGATGSYQQWTEWAPQSVRSHWFLSNSGLNGPRSRSGATGSYQTVDWMGPTVCLEPLVPIKQWTEWAPQSVWKHWFLSVDWMGPRIGLEPLVPITQWTEWTPQSVWTCWQTPSPAVIKNRMLIFYLVGYLVLQLLM
jgi:hypothetical protein